MEPDADACSALSIFRGSSYHQQRLHPAVIVMESGGSHHISPIQPKLVVNHILNSLVNLKIGPSSRSLKSVSSWLLKSVFWFAIYLLSSFLTINSCVSLLNDYSSAPILTRVTANMANVVPLANLTVCVPFNATLMFPLNSSSAAPYSDAIEDFFSKTIVSGRFDTTSYIKEWNNSIEMISNEMLFILHKYLTVMHEAEYLREEIENPFNNSLWYEESDQKYALLNITVPRIEQMNITTDEIKNVFIEYFKIGSTELQGASTNRNSDGVLFCIYRDNYDSDQCDFFDTISYLDQNQICFNVYNMTLQANDVNLNYIHVEINDRSEAIKMSGRKIIFNFNEDATPLNFAAAANESSIIEMITYGHKKMYIDYEDVYRALPRMSNGTLSCSYQSRRECEENCRRDLIKGMCSCTPVTFTNGQSDKNKCTFTHYEKCLKYSGNEDEECRKNCPVSCNQTNYKISKPYRSESIWTPYLFFALRIELNKYDYLIYEEEFKWTFTDLISAIGGALGIWLGIDFIVLIQFIFTLMAKVFLKVLSLANLEAATSEDNQFNFNDSIIKKVFTALNIEVPPRFTRVSRIMWLIGKGLWAIIYLAGGVFTAKFCFQLGKQYVSGEMKTSMHVSFNNSIALPPVTLCLRQNIYYYNINPSFAPSSNYTDALSDYLNQKNISKENILEYGSNNSSWPPVMVYAVYKYLSVLYSYEYYDAVDYPSDECLYPINEWQKLLSAKLYYWDSWSFEYCGNYTNDTNFNADDSRDYPDAYFTCQAQLTTAHDLDCANAIENVLIPKLTELNITVQELRQKTLYQLNSDAQLTFRFFGSNKNAVINNLRATAFGLYFYCMHIPLDNFEITSEKDYAEIAIKDNKILDEEDFDPIFFTFDATFAALGSSFTLMDEEKREETEVGYVYGMRFGESRSFSLRINYKMTLEPDSKKCSNVESVKELDIQYRIQYFEEMCNCSPTSWPELLPSASRMCTLQEYTTCLIFDESSWFYTNRNDKTRLPCEKIKMDIKPSEIYDLETNLTNTSISRIRIRVEDFVYLAIKEEMTMTFVQFVVAFGGTLGILLGLDFRYIAWLIFTPPFVLISQALKKLLLKKTFFLKSMKNTRLKYVISSKSARLIASILNQDLSDILKLNKFAFITKVSKNFYWLFYYTAGGILTFLLLLSVVINYMRNVNAKVKLETMRNESISLPSPTICLPFVPFKIDSDHGKSNIDSMSFVQNYFSDKKKVALLNDKWNHAFINYLHSYIVQYGKYEWFSFDDLPKNMDHLAFVDVVDNMTNIMDITFEQLREKFGREIAQIYNLNIAFYANASNDTTANLSISVYTLIVEESKICYKPSMETLTFNSSSDYLKITANGTLKGKPGEYFAQLAPVTIDLNGRNTSKKGATILDATVSGSFSKSTTIALEIDTIIKAYPIVGGEMRCSDLLPLYQCRSSCVAEVIQNTCKCLPRTITVTTSSYETVQFCTLADYKKCNLTLQSDAFPCLDGCLEPCERIRYSKWSSITESSLESSSHAEVYLRITSFKYQYMEEQLTYTTEEFIGAIGGALGTFLGLNILMFIEFFYALFMRLFDICVTKTWAIVQPMP